MSKHDLLLWYISHNNKYEIWFLKINAQVNIILAKYLRQSDLFL